ncbi:MAG: GNAT family N-acetyltransferase [Nanoarchaeota archaeon]|nr:GNAT family N-acetyltransferase [Nanoarchaeota archaeon]
MEIIKATNEYSKEISKLMLLDLKNPNSSFPPEIINNFREHAKEENIIKEFENPKLIAFIAIDEDKVIGFVVGYEKDPSSAMIHYISAKSNEVKKELLDSFIKECKVKKVNRIITDTFEFMDNNNFFKSNGFTLTKKENVTPTLEMLWYELNF